MALAFSSVATLGCNMETAVVSVYDALICELARAYANAPTGMRARMQARYDTEACSHFCRRYLSARFCASALLAGR
eukprot:2071332-Pleurochrysis_carterae.AAC.1